MNRILNYRTLALLLILPLLFGSCKKKSDIKPLSQLKKEQRRAIDRLISSKNLKVINRDNELLPEEIDKSVFYRLSNGTRRWRQGEEGCRREDSCTRPDEGRGIQ